MRSLVGLFVPGTLDMTFPIGRGVNGMKSIVGGVRETGWTRGRALPLMGGRQEKWSARADAVVTSDESVLLWLRMGGIGTSGRNLSRAYLYKAFLLWEAAIYFS